MPFFQLDVSKCKRDGVCEKVCVAGIIKNDETRTPYIDEANASKCIACGLCVAFCPHDACSVEKLDNTQFISVDKNSKVNREDIDTFLKSRRSVRQYRKQTVESDVLNKIFDSVRYAPSAKNTQAGRWIVTKSREDTLKLADIVSTYFEELSKKDKTPDAVKYRMLSMAHRQGIDVFLRNAPHVAVMVMPKEYEWKTEDGSIALTYFELAAGAHGVGTCWGGYFTVAGRNHQPLREALGVEENEFVCGAQMFGYPLYKVHKIPSRKNTKLTIL